MQQGLQLLQAPVLELRQLVAAELATNPVLEEIPPETDAGITENEDSRSDTEELWETYYGPQASPDRKTAEESQQRRMELITAPPSMLEKLAGQLGWIPLEVRDRELALEILGSLDERGYLGTSVKELAAHHDRTPLETESTLKRLQQYLDPPGLAALDLKECLQIQLERSGEKDSTAWKIVERGLEDLGRRRLAELARNLSVSLKEVEEAAERISRLDPAPGRVLNATEAAIVIPEILVEKDEEGWSVRLAREWLPSLKINQEYKDLLGQGDRSTRDYLRERIRSGRFFLRMLEQRASTLLAIAREIVLRQEAFLDEGPQALQPLKMATVAEAVGVHETTVSRAVCGKYMETPRGVYELRYFFTTGLETADGGSVSNESIRTIISELVASESTTKPLSDQEMLNLLSDRGIRVARRTIAKYRDQLGILPSHLRRRP